MEEVKEFHRLDLEAQLWSYGYPWLLAIRKENLTSMTSGKLFGFSAPLSSEKLED
jgi:hypothetical protein